jgi:hypothetical protein
MGWSTGRSVRLTPPGVDEIQYGKGHKYLTLVYQIDLGVTRLLWVGRERTIESFQGFFTVIGDELASKIDSADRNAHCRTGSDAPPRFKMDTAISGISSPKGRNCR